MQGGSSWGVLGRPFLVQILSDMAEGPSDGDCLEGGSPTSSDGGSDADAWLDALHAIHADPGEPAPVGAADLLEGLDALPAQGRRGLDARTKFIQNYI